ncbi:hypothetical protein HETIRDRAFT_406624 [Heterobasidion irregulare TC 32-1]|uniref:Uncharacterized protein n=1 Tax=Heterobasidion irregulare (strain TC 32-1) TaxID=747525 RepID=W4KLI2_HETIT|nr:uncharacterized protein HETIRDRAFT_406624 [Heterobasidion irregulare TC 32-1]ETW86687.1 hypothetical protein HETIRDRAFT_406624 [Heterobasidion irregulare TC 32-1]
MVDAFDKTYESVKVLDMVLPGHNSRWRGCIQRHVKDGEGRDIDLSKQTRHVVRSGDDVSVFYKVQPLYTATALQCHL